MIVSQHRGRINADLLWATLRGTAILALMILHSVAPVSASFTFTALPGNEQDGVRIDGGVATFTAYNSDFSEFGLRQYANGSLTTIATTTTPLPGGTSGNFHGFDAPWMDGPSVVFASPAIQSETLKGIYKSDNGALSTIADTNTTIPGTPFKFRFLLYPSISNDVVSFVGANSTFQQQGVYRSTGGVLQTIASNNTVVPGTSFTFGDFYGAPIWDGSSTVFRGGYGGNTGLYRSTNGVLEAIYSPQTQMPIANQPGDQLLAVAHTTPTEYAADSGNVAFFGVSTRADDALFLNSDGVVNVIADTQTAIPGGVGNFSSFSRVTSVSGDFVAFAGFGSNGLQGLYTTLGGSLTKVIDTSDSLAGHGPIHDINITQQAISGNSIGFVVRFEDGSRAGYLATLGGEPNSTTVEIGGSGGPSQASLLGGANGGQAGGLDVDFNAAVETGGTFQAAYTTPDESTFADSFTGTAGFDLGNFLTTGPDGKFQVWDLDFSGTLTDEGAVTLEFKYDDAGLSPLDEQLLGIWHYGKYGLNGAREWKWLRDSIDTVANVITITTDSFSPFAPGLQPTTSGDFDNDGDVDGRDFLAWQRGESPNPLSAEDLALWQNNYNQSVLSASTAVPEPSTLVVAAMMAVAGPLSRKRLA